MKPSCNSHGSDWMDAQKLPSVACTPWCCVDAGLCSWASLSQWHSGHHTHVQSPPAQVHFPSLALHVPHKILYSQILTLLMSFINKSQPWDCSWSLTSVSSGVLAQSMGRACEQNVERWDMSEDVHTLMLTFFHSYFNRFYYFLWLGQKTSSFFTSFDSFKF